MTHAFGRAEAMGAPDYELADADRRRAVAARRAFNLQTTGSPVPALLALAAPIFRPRLSKDNDHD